MMKNKNFLDFIPIHNPDLKWTASNNQVILKIHNKGFYNTIARVFFKRPEYSYIKLDDFASFVWMEIDGIKTVYEIGKNVENKFGNKAYPLYERLTKFILILYRNGYIVYQ